LHTEQRTDLERVKFGEQNSAMSFKASSCSLCWSTWLEFPASQYILIKIQGFKSLVEE